MASITFTIPDEHAQRFMNAMLFKYPNKEKQPKPGEEPNENGTYHKDQLELIYTDTQWIKEVIRRFIVREVKTSEIRKANQETIKPEDQDNLIL